MRIKLSHVKTVNRQGTSRIPAAHMLISYYQKKNGQSLSQKVMRIKLSHVKTVNRQGTSRIPAAHMLISYYQKKKRSKPQSKSW
jgi:hypothetical protein